jgi:hypothetical protein
MLGSLFTYIWKANGKIQENMMMALERIKETQKEIVKIIEQGHQRAEQS